MDSGQSATVTVDINNGRAKIQIRRGTSLLAGLARNGLFLPSACGGNARCGYCKIKVIAPSAPPSDRELPLLSKDEISAGTRLGCQTKPLGDIAIEIPPEIFFIKRFSGRVTRKALLTYDTLGLNIELTNPKSIEFTAGQYVQVKSMPYDGRDAVLRDFSIASPPFEKSFVDLMIRRTKNGIFTGWAFDHLKEGDSVSFSGPYGTFRTSETDAPMLMVCGSTGLAPIWSMLQDLVRKECRRSIRCFFGALTQKDLFMLEELSRLESSLPDFRFIPALSNEPEGNGWTGERGLITDVVRRHVPDCSGFEAYLCGSPGMINACVAVLTQYGMPAENIFFDKFA
ncbi:MAG TPA: 2Fe-2S iron-sulfur cluster binding domain-containing protein [Chitinivibrionales bacterium]|jgi:Na+-transporting NADH:ubiquinone oxidoreductase subunit F|nr:2Fe-2S iron-sulfur cluster binding domain-containing protein [Chitinivibrionales bacterium]